MMINDPLDPAKRGRPPLPPGSTAPGGGDVGLGGMVMPGMGPTTMPAPAGGPSFTGQAMPNFQRDLSGMAPVSDILGGQMPGGSRPAPSPIGAAAVGPAGGTLGPSGPGASSLMGRLAAPPSFRSALARRVRRNVA